MHKSFKLTKEESIFKDIDKRKFIDVLGAISILLIFSLVLIFLVYFFVVFFPKLIPFAIVAGALMILFKV